MVVLNVIRNCEVVRRNFIQEIFYSMHMFVHNFFCKRCIIIGYCLNKPGVLGINLRCIIIFLHKIGTYSNDHIFGNLCRGI